MENSVSVFETSLTRSASTRHSIRIVRKILKTQKQKGKKNQPEHGKLRLGNFLKGKDQ